MLIQKYHENYIIGNSNIAFRNMYNNLNKSKLTCIITMLKIYIERFSDEENEIVNWLENDINVFFCNYGNKDCILDNQLLNNSPFLLRSASFENIVLFLLKTDIKTIRKLLKFLNTKNEKLIMASANESMFGGSFFNRSGKIRNELNTLIEFTKCDLSKTNNIIKLLKLCNKFNLPYANMDDSIDDNLINYLVYDCIKDPDTTKFEFSNRDFIFDIWRIIIYLYTKTTNKDIEQIITNTINSKKK